MISLATISCFKRVAAASSLPTATSHARSASDVAFVGLGAMGYPLAANLKKRGGGSGDVLVWDQAEAKARRHASEFGTRPASSLDDLGSCSLVFTCLPTSVQVESVCSRLGPLLSPGSIVADCTSGDPNATRRIASSLAENDVQMVDCAVSGGPAGAASGELTSMVGGPDAAVEAVEPYLRRMARKKIVRVGPVGAGHAVKAVNNTLNAGSLVMTAEGLLALAEFGISPDAALDAINGSSGRSLQTEERMPREVLSREFDYGFPLKLMLKDVRIAVDSVCGEDAARPGSNADAEHGVPKFFPLVEDILQRAVDLESEEVDYTNVVRPLEAKSGLELHAGKFNDDGEYSAPFYVPSMK